MFKLKMLFSNIGYHVTVYDVTVTLWQTVIYFVYKLSLTYRSFKAVAGCPPDSSSSRTVHQHTQHAAHATGELSRFHHKRPMASKFAEYKPRGLSCVVCNVGGLPQA